MALLPPSKADDSLGRVKVDRPSPFPRTPDLRYDVPASEWEQVKDCIIAAYEAGAGATRVLAKWNETDTSQFGAQVSGSIAGGAPSGSVALSVVADSEIPDRKRLRFALTAFDGSWTFFPWTGLALPARYVMRVKMHIPSGSGGASDFPAVLLVTNLVAGMTRTDLYGYVYDLNRGVNYLIEAGARVTGSTPAWSSPAAGFNQKAGALHEVEVVRDDDPNGQAEPRFSIFSKYMDSAGGSLDAISSDQYGAAFAAGWNGLTLSRAGIGVLTNSSRTENLEIAELAFLKHPMDE